ncbi:MAG: hypothetical protein DWQ10_09090 [Calditrichaeota bacterium]|nr:MAG: hypothetical protein DWQ10_09090 [Calditrichota bacterium]
MKKLYLVRHADAESPHFGGSDFNRKLTAFGENKATSLGLLLKNRYIDPDLIVSSDALRAKQTAHILAETLNYKKQIVQENKIYMGGEQQLNDFLMMLDPDIKSVVLVGHNPTLSAFAHTQALQASYSMQPAGVIGLTYSVHDWSEINSRDCSFLFYEWPK